ncbi:hypothetical protein KC315_g13355 [Hortaea werneckii]|nr:hypothetical protein KC315_g13355 [Hortaea werneckii]
MPRNADSPLMKLSPELRNRIYREVLVSGAIVRMTDTYGNGEWSPPALLHTCRRIRREASGIYYSMNAFLFCSADFTLLDEEKDFEIPMQEEICRIMIVRWFRALRRSARTAVQRIFIDDHYHFQADYEYDETEVIPDYARYRQMLSWAGVRLSSDCGLFLELRFRRLPAHIPRRPIWRAEDGEEIDEDERRELFEEERDSEPDVSQDEDSEAEY